MSGFFKELELSSRGTIEKNARALDVESVWAQVKEGLGLLRLDLGMASLDRWCLCR